MSSNKYLMSFNRITGSNNNLKFLNIPNKKLMDLNRIL